MKVRLHRFGVKVRMWGWFIKLGPKLGSRV